MIFQPVNSKLDRRYPFFSCLIRPGMAGGINLVGWVGDLECDCEHQQFSEDFFAVGGASVCVYPAAYRPYWIMATAVGIGVFWCLACLLGWGIPGVVMAVVHFSTEMDPGGV